MSTANIYKQAIDYLSEEVGTENVYYWKLTEKSLVWYGFDKDGRKGQRHVIPNGDF